MKNRGSTPILTNAVGVHPRNIHTKFEANPCSGLRGEVEKLKSSRRQQRQRRQRQRQRRRRRRTQPDCYSHTHSLSVTKKYLKFIKCLLNSKMTFKIAQIFFNVGILGCHSFFKFNFPSLTMPPHSNVYSSIAKSDIDNSYPLTNMEINCAMSTFSKIFVKQFHFP